MHSIEITAHHTQLSLSPFSVVVTTVPADIPMLVVASAPQCASFKDLALSHSIAPLLIQLRSLHGGMSVLDSYLHHAR
jgi:hypothetical protein